LSTVTQAFDHPHATDITQRLGYLKTRAKTKAATFIQQFGNLLNRSIYFKMLFRQDTITETQGLLRLKRLKAPKLCNVEQGIDDIRQHIAQYLETHGSFNRAVRMLI
jgi:hypothetical protein